MAGLGLVGFDAEHVGAVRTAAYPAEITPSGAYCGGHHDCGAFDVGIDGDEVLAVVEDDGEPEEGQLLLLLLHHDDVADQATMAHEGQSCFSDEPAFVMVVKSVHDQQAHDCVDYFQLKMGPLRPL